MKTLKINGKFLLICSFLASFFVANKLLAEADMQKKQLKAMQQEQTYRQQQQDYKKQDKEQYNKLNHEKRHYAKQIVNAEHIQVKEMEEQKQLYLQAMEKQQPEDSASAKNDINQQATQSELEGELEDYDEKLKMQGSY